MTELEAVNWIINLSADIGKIEHQDLWHYEQGLYEIRELLENHQQAQQWIPVTERFPENDDWVIVTIRDECGDSPFIYSDFGWYLKEASCWIVDADQRRDIIAWMPLPKPHGGEK